MMRLLRWLARQARSDAPAAAVTEVATTLSGPIMSVCPKCRRVEVGETIVNACRNCGRIEHDTVQL